MLLPLESSHIRRFGEKLCKSAPRGFGKAARALKAYFHTPRKAHLHDFPKLTLAGGTQWISYRKGDWALVSRPEGEELTAAVLEFLEYAGFVDPAADRGEIGYRDIARRLAPFVQFGFSLAVEYLQGPDEAESGHSVGPGPLCPGYGRRTVNGQSTQGGEHADTVGGGSYFPGEDFPQALLMNHGFILLRIKAFPGYLERGLGSIEWRRS